MQRIIKDLTPKSISTSHKRHRKKNLKALKKSRIKKLGLIESMSMRFAGWSDGRKKLFHCTEDTWQSTFLQNESDAYEEFCAKLFGNLKIEEENTHNELQYLLEQVYILMTKLHEAQNKLKTALDKPENFKLRKAGEELLDDSQVGARRNRERHTELKLLSESVNQYTKQLHCTIDTIFLDYSQLKEHFDTSRKIINRVCEHSRQRVDVYWRSATRKYPELPATHSIIYSNTAQQEFQNYFLRMDERIAKLRSTIETPAFTGGKLNNEKKFV